MSIDNPTNLGRVQKITEALALIEKSAVSNKAGPEALSTLLAPAIEALSALGVIQAGGPSPTRRGPEEQVLTAGQRAALHLADRASLRELIAALMGRLDAQSGKLQRDAGDQDQ